MYEYQINVSVNGRHLFRTDWYDTKEVIKNIAVTIKSSMPLATVSVKRRTLVTQSVEVGADLQINFNQGE